MRQIVILQRSAIVEADTFNRYKFPEDRRSPGELRRESNDFPGIIGEEDSRTFPEEEEGTRASTRAHTGRDQSVATPLTIVRFGKENNSAALLFNLLVIKNFPRLSVLLNFIKKIK